MKKITFVVSVFVAWMMMSCSTTPATPDACLKITDIDGNEITSATLNTQIVFVNCGERTSLNALYTGIKLPKKGVNSTEFGVTTSVGVAIPTNGYLNYTYINETEFGGNMEVVFFTTNVADKGQKSVKSKEIRKTLTIN